MRFALLPFILLTLLGLIVCVGASLTALLAHQVLINHATLVALFWGAAACVLPASLVQGILFSQRPELRRDPVAARRVPFSGCPRWVRRLCFGLVAYGFIVGLVAAAFDQRSSGPPAPASRALTLAQARNFSAGLTIPYAVLLPLLLSVFRRPSLLRADAPTNIGTSAIRHRFSPLLEQTLFDRNVQVANNVLRGPEGLFTLPPLPPLVSRPV